MHMGMMQQLLIPRVQDAEKADLRDLLVTLLTALQSLTLRVCHAKRLP